LIIFTQKPGMTKILRSYLLPVLIALLASASLISAQNPRIVGYLPYYRFGLLDSIRLERLTHLCIAFANPDSAGHLSVNGLNIAPIVEKAHAQNVQVLISVAGGYLRPEWHAAWKQHMAPANRTAFIAKIMSYTRRHELQGVDVDLEWQYVDSLYSGFVLELADSLHWQGMLLTAALPGTYRYPEISDAALASFDFINLMAYDLTGPWAPGSPGQHSPYSLATNSINYWKNRHRVPGRKLTLGVPFYGYDFTNPTSTKSFTFGSMVVKDPANAQLDQVGLSYYNGIPTIEAKTELAIADVSGIMIWELGQDAFNQYSLLEAIYRKVSQLTGVDGSAPETGISVFPNPFSGQFFLALPAGGKAFQLTLFDQCGRPVWLKSGLPEEHIQVDTAELPPGIYYLRASDGQQLRTIKLMKP
jgi:hypothetical protein